MQDSVHSKAVRACRENDSNTLKKLIYESPPGTLASFCAMRCAENGYLDPLQLLMDMKSPHRIQISGLVRAACNGGHLEVFQYLLRISDPEQPDRSLDLCGPASVDSLAFASACVSGNQVIIDTLLSLDPAHGGPVDPHIESGFLRACSAGRVGIVRRLLSLGESRRIDTGSCSRAIVPACQQPDPAVLRELLQEPRFRPNLAGVRRAIREAVKGARVGIIKTLIEFVGGLNSIQTPTVETDAAVEGLAGADLAVGGLFGSSESSDCSSDSGSSDRSSDSSVGAAADDTGTVGGSRSSTSEAAQAQAEDGQASEDSEVREHVLNCLTDSWGVPGVWDIIRAAARAGDNDLLQDLLVAWRRWKLVPPAPSEMACILQAACHHGQAATAELLLGLTGDMAVDVHADGQEACLAAAIHSGSMPTVRVIMGLTGERAPRVDELLRHHRCSLHREPCYQGNTEMVRFVLGLRGADGARASLQFDGFHSLARACLGKHEDLACMLIEMDDDRRPSTKKDLCAAMATACEKGLLRVVRALVGLEGDRRLDHLDGDYHSMGAVYKACIGKQPHVLRFLLSIQDDRWVNMASTGSLALKFASEKGAWDCVHAIMSRPLPEGLEPDRLKARLPPKEAYNKYYPGSEPYSLWQHWVPRPRMRRMVEWRRAAEAWRDAALLLRCCREGRPLELQKRLWQGKLAAGGDRLQELLGIAEAAGNEECADMVRKALGSSGGP